MRGRNSQSFQVRTVSTPAEIVRAWRKRPRMADTMPAIGERHPRVLVRMLAASLAAPACAALSNQIAGRLACKASSTQPPVALFENCLGASVRATHVGSLAQ